MVQIEFHLQVSSIGEVQEVLVLCGESQEKCQQTLRVHDSVSQSVENILLSVAVCNSEQVLANDASSSLLAEEMHNFTTILDI